MFEESGSFLAELIYIAGDDNVFQLERTPQSVPNAHPFNFQLDAYLGATPIYCWSSNPCQNNGVLGKPGDNKVHMVAIDITDLYNTKYGTAKGSVIMFGWESLHSTAANGGLHADWDYQDIILIMTDVTPVY